MSMAKEFREFAMKGNVLDLAVGVVIGAAFGKIVSSLVDDILMPILGKLTGGLDFKNLFVNLSATPVATIAEAKEKGVAILKYGAFIQNVLDFVIVAFAIFMIVKMINRLRREPAAPAK